MLILWQKGIFFKLKIEFYRRTVRLNTCFLNKLMKHQFLKIRFYDEKKESRNQIWRSWLRAQPCGTAPPLVEGSVSGRILVVREVRNKMTAISLSQPYLSFLIILG